MQRGAGDHQCIQEADQVQGEKEKEHIRYNLIIPTLYCVFIIYANENAGNLISVVQFLRNKYIYITAILDRNKINMDPGVLNKTIMIEWFKHNLRLTVGSCTSQKRENLRFSTSLTLLRSYSVYLVNRQPRIELN